MLRKDGILYLDVKCKGGEKVKVPLFFSFKAREERERELIATKFLPPGIEKHLFNNEFFILKDLFGALLVRARLREEVSKGEYLIELTGDKMVDKRVYDRFNFCPEDFGFFELKKNNKVISGVQILDISLSGVKLLVPGRVEVKEGEFILLIKGTKVMNLQVVRVNEGENSLIIGTKIVSTNFDLVSFINSHYVDLVKSLL